MGVISFAQSKAIVTGIRGSGGALLVNRPSWTAEASQICGALPFASHRLGPLADFLWNHIAHIYTGHSGYYFIRVLSALGVKQHREPAPATQISNLEAGIALAQLDRLDLLLHEKVRIADLYFQALQKHPNLQFPQFAPGRFLARVMLLLPEGVDVARIRREALALGVETRSGYTAQAGDGQLAPVAEAMAGRLVGVPCRSGLDFADVKAVCSALDSLIENGRQVSVVHSC
jgi:dTDP-4-amino-4,6-dideoxygalactose transaminase